MAESKIKMNSWGTRELRMSLLRVAELTLSEKVVILIMHKINYCNARKAVSFASAFCDTSRPKYLSSSDNVQLYSLGSIYTTGWKILNEFLNNGKEPEDRDKWSALKALVDYVEGGEWMDLGKRLRHKDWSETEVSVILLHHCLSKLAASPMDQPPYIMDKYCKNKMRYCPCCSEQIAGQFDDTSIGNPEVWHGRIDAIVTGNVCITNLEQSDDDDTSDPEDVECLSAIVKREYMEKDASQALAQTITFSFLQHSKKPEQIPLYPNISVSRKMLQFHFYDSVNDILLSSLHLFELCDHADNLDFTVMVSLWFILNHSLFCTGVTQSMKDYSFNADFLKNEEEVKEIYRTQLEFHCEPGKQEDMYWSELLHTKRLTFCDMNVDDDVDDEDDDENEPPFKKLKLKAADGDNV